MAYDERNDELMRGRGGRVYEGTPEEQRRGGQRPSESGVYSGTPEGQDGTPAAGGSPAEYGPLGWADVPGRPAPQVADAPAHSQPTDARGQGCECPEPHPGVNCPA